MTALFIILAIAVLICLLLLCPITVKATYREEFAVVVSYLFFRFRFPGPESDESQMEASEAEEEKAEDSGIFGKYKEMLKRKGLSGLLSLLSEITQALKKASKKAVARGSRPGAFAPAFCCGRGCGGYGAPVSGKPARWYIRRFPRFYTPSAIITIHWRCSRTSPAGKLGLMVGPSSGFGHFPHFPLPLG